jgi:hypothetical protein
VDADLDTLATALYVTVDDLLKTTPQLAPWRPRVGIAPKLSDAALVTLAVMQALLGFVSEARWLRHANRHLRHLFPYLPGQSGGNKRLRRTAELLRHAIRAVTQPFCRTCTRARLATDGKLYTCLFAAAGHDLRALLRTGASDQQLVEALAGIWGGTSRPLLRAARQPHPQPHRHPPADRDVLHRRLTSSGPDDARRGPARGRRPIAA